MKLAHSLSTLVCLLPGAAAAQTSYVAPDGHNRFPAVTIFCPSGTGVAPCNFGSGGGTSGSVSLTQGGSPLSAGNRLPVQDTSLDALISGGALSIGGTVGLAGGSAVSVSNLPATQAVSGTVNVSNLPATQAVSGAVNVSNLPATQNVNGAVSISNLPATQAISAASLPLPAGAATAAGQTASLGPVAPGTAAANSTLAGCVANTVLPSFAAGQQGALPCDTSGRLYVVTVPSANNVPAYLQAVPSGGATAFRAINAASSTMATNVKSSTGMVYAYEACNTGSAAAYLRLFALGTAPVVGTSTPLISKLLAPGACQQSAVAVGLLFGTGIAFDVTSGSMADSDTAVIAAANQVSVGIYYK